MSVATDEPDVEQGEHGFAYNIFILVLTIYSLVIMGLLVLPLDEATHEVLRVYDNVICGIFLVDFFITLRASRPDRRDYFIRRRGWLDLIGSIPSFGILRFTALFRLFRLSRLARIARLMRRKDRPGLIQDVIQNRGQYAIFITFLSAFLVLTSASVLVLQFESRSPDANIVTGGDALWWGLVTITTVGYGDYFPVTSLGRMVGVFVMFAGVGIIGALASILASILVPPPGEAAGEPAPEPPTPAGQQAHTESAIVAKLERELAGIRAELSALHQLMRDHARGGTTQDPTREA